MDEKYCPLMFMCPGDKLFFGKPLCIRSKCAWWNASIGECGIVVDALLKGWQIERQEAGK